jgi:hypothetical protein
VNTSVIKMSTPVVGGVARWPYGGLTRPKQVNNVDMTLVPGSDAWRPRQGQRARF